MDLECKICGKKTGIFLLGIPDEDNEEEVAYQLPVCGTCWEIIAHIALRAIEGTYELKKKENL